MKKILLKLVLLCGVMAFFASCEKPEAEKPILDDQLVVGITYNLALGDAWFEFYDITVTYLDLDGNEKNVVIKEKFEYFETIPYKYAPDKYSFRAVARLKPGVTAESPLPDKVYSVGEAVYVNAAKYNLNGDLVGYFSKTIDFSHQTTVSGSMIYDGWMAKHPEKELVNFSASKN